MKHEFARQLRREQTVPEHKLWLALRSRRFHGFKFRRQQPIGPYVADFVCFENKLVVELDGDQHGTEQGLRYDAVRSRKFQRDGFKVLRFSNHELLTNFEGVLEGIVRALGASS
jgi:very-short-patch-repair endonuclease